MGETSRLSRWLVRARLPLLAVTVFLAIAGGCLVPGVRVNSDMTKYLPGHSSMRQGLDKMQEAFSGTGFRTMSVMFRDSVKAAEASPVLDSLVGGLIRTATLVNDGHTLFRYNLSESTDVEAVEEELAGRWGESVVVEVDGQDYLPGNLGSILLLGVGLAFAVLIVMSASVAEVLLFLLCTGIAVALNLGTNYFLPSVSNLTHMLSAVLQMILSMDYSIILMNRFRDEKKVRPDKAKALAAAIHGASSAILSSAFTTVVSLSMLCFMKFGIGVDLGVVLAKGVLFSLVCNFTVLPALIMAFDRAVEATRKKVPGLPSRAMARFGMKWRYVLLAVCVVVFAASLYLQSRTPITFSMTWETPVTKVFPPDNPIVVLYPSSREEAAAPLLEEFGRDPKVHEALGYGNTIGRAMDCGEMSAFMAPYMPGGADPGMLSLLFYYYAHPERDETFSLEELLGVVEKLSASGMVPASFDMSRLGDIASAGQAAPAPAKAAKTPKAAVNAPASQSGPPSAAPAGAAAKADSVSVVTAPADTTATTTANAAAEPQAQAPDSLATTSGGAPEPYSGRFTYAEATTPLDPGGMASLLGGSKSQMRTIFRMAGKKTMSPREFVHYFLERVLPDKRYKAFISRENADSMRELRTELDAAFEAGPPAPAEETPSQVSASDSLAHAAADSLAASSVHPAPAVDSTASAATVQPVAGPPVEPVVEDDPPTPQDRLFDLYVSGRRLTSQALYKELRAAGVKVGRDEVDMLFLYAAADGADISDVRMTPKDLVGFLQEKIIPNPLMSSFLDDNSARAIASAGETISQAEGMFKGEGYSMAVLQTAYERESDETYEFVERLQARCREAFGEDCYIIGESSMCKELRDGFPSELLLLTLLTVMSIYLIVAFTFRSALLPVPLVMTVLSGVYIDVYASGIVGGGVYFLCYLIIQGILMGATIDYSILFTSCYRRARRTLGRQDSLCEAYRLSEHSILTSGLIMVVVPSVMGVTLPDPVISSILTSLSIGAFSVLVLVLLVLPGVLAALDFKDRSKEGAADRS